MAFDVGALRLCLRDRKWASDAYMYPYVPTIVLPRVSPGAATPCGMTQMTNNLVITRVLLPAVAAAPSQNSPGDRQAELHPGSPSRAYPLTVRLVRNHQ